MRLKLFFLIDVFTTAIFSAFVYFNSGVDAAFFTGLSIFIAFSPICLALSTPMVLRLAKKAIEDEGVIVNDSEAITALADVDTVAMPLNNFLMDGDYFITDLVPTGFTQSSLLSFAATAEKNASHILGQAIYNAAVNRALNLQSVSAFREIPSKGVEALVNNTPLRVGNPQWVAKQGVSVSAELLTKSDQLAARGKIPLLVSLGNMARGIVALRDDVDKTAKEFVTLLKRNKLTTVLLTAANKKTAKNLAKNFSIDELKANLSPEDKAREVQIFRAKGNNVAVIANEFHDLPALINADVSFLLKDGSFVLNQSGGVQIDFEITTLEKFLIVREISLKAVDLIKTNKKVAYASWILLLPLALTTIMQNPPIPFHPIASVAGVLIFSALILSNSLRMKK